MEIAIIAVLIIALLFFLQKNNNFSHNKQKPLDNKDTITENDKIIVYKNRESEKENERIKKILDTKLRSNTLMNKSEYKTFQALNRILENSTHKNQNYRLFCQVGLGGFIQIDNDNDFKYWSKTEKDAFWAYNSLRADFLIIDMFGKPILVIEYQGSGHRITNSSDRDTRKRVACQKAGIELIEVYDNFKEDDAEKVFRTLKHHYNKLKNITA